MCGGTVLSAEALSTLISRRNNARIAALTAKSARMVFVISATNTTEMRVESAFSYQSSVLDIEDVNHVELIVVNATEMESVRSAKMV